MVYYVVRGDNWNDVLLKSEDVQKIAHFVLSYGGHRYAIGPYKWKNCWALYTTVEPHTDPSHVTVLADADNVADAWAALAQEVINQSAYDCDIEVIGEEEFLDYRKDANAFFDEFYPVGD